MPLQSQQAPSQVVVHAIVFPSVPFSYKMYRQMLYKLKYIQRLNLVTIINLSLSKFNRKISLVLLEPSVNSIFKFSLKLTPTSLWKVHKVLSPWIKLQKSINNLRFLTQLFPSRDQPDRVFRYIIVCMTAILVLPCLCYRLELVCLPNIFSDWP